MYYFAIPAILLETNGLIRQGVAFGISLIAIRYYNEKKWIPFFIFSILSINTHTILLIFLSTYVLLSVFPKKTIPLYISLLLYTTATFASDVLDLDIISNIVSGINLDNKYQSYLDNSEAWFSNESKNEEWKQGTIALILTYLYSLSIIIIGYLSLKKRMNSQVNITYNMMVIGFISVRFLFLNEIFKRFFLPMQMIYFIPLGYAIYIMSRYKNNISRKEKNLYYICIFFITIYLISFWGRFIFLSPNFNFIWN